MLCGFKWSMAEFALGVGAIVSEEPFSCQIVTAEELDVMAESQYILGGINASESWVGCTRQTLNLNIQILHFGVGHSLLSQYSLIVDSDICFGNV